MMPLKTSALHRHPSAANDPVQGIEALVRAGPEGGLLFQFVLHASLEQLRLPAPAPALTPAMARRSDRLWQHTCFEAFLRTRGAAAYHEFNFSPSGEWAAYRFEAYRTGMAEAPLRTAPQLAVRTSGDRLELDAHVAWHEITGLRAEQQLDCALSAVIEQANGTISYWALQHASGKPDFHNPDGFVLELALL
jgi:hypothetical protein